MTGKSAFSPDEWEQVVEGPPRAGLLVITASPGGTFRETFAMSKAYVEARSAHGESELLDAIVSERPRVQHEKAHNPEELKAETLTSLRDVITLLEQKATPEERDDYQRFVLAVANKVAEAHREGGDTVNPGEAQAIADITSALGAGGS